MSASCRHRGSAITPQKPRGTDVSTLAEDYLSARDGSVSDYHHGLDQGHRIGQAFFNALNLRDSRKLQGTVYDPFNAPGRVAAEHAVHRAIEWLLDTEDAP